jgi:hypothetical protein
MAITLDAATLVFSIPQADLTLVGGTLYDADTDALRQEMMALLASERYAYLADCYTHSTEVTVAGVTYARTLITKGGYSYTFTPNSQWTARLVGSNNDFFDVENNILNQNQVQVIPTNSAGLQVVSSGSGLSSAQADQLIEIWRNMGEDPANPKTITENTLGTSYDEEVGGQTKEVRKVGAVTTITKQ